MIYLFPKLGPLQDYHIIVKTTVSCSQGSGSVAKPHNNDSAFGALDIFSPLPAPMHEDLPFTEVADIISANWNKVRGACTSDPPPTRSGRGLLDAERSRAGRNQILNMITPFLRLSDTALDQPLGPGPFSKAKAASIAL